MYIWKIVLYFYCTVSFVICFIFSSEIHEKVENVIIFSLLCFGCLEHFIRSYPADSGMFSHFVAICEPHSDIAFKAFGGKYNNRFFYIHFVWQNAFRTLTLFYQKRGDESGSTIFSEIEIYYSKVYLQ